MNSTSYKSIATIFLFLLCQFGFAQDKATLRKDIERILANYQARIGIAVHNQDFSDSLIVAGNYHFPFQSVYKFHLGIAVLNQVDNGILKLDQPIRVSKAAVTTDLYSPIKDKYPDGVTLPLSEVIKYTIAESDNVGCDILFELLGGPDAVQAYFSDKGYGNLSIKLTEAVQQKEWDLQFANWTTVGSCNHILYDYYTNRKRLLSPTSHQFLWDTMRGTKTGVNRIKGDLPTGTVVAHKTGYSGQNKQTGITAAVNDIGVVSLPNGDVFYMTVLVTDSKEEEPVSAKAIAEVSKAAYDYFTAR